jgi:hypothetical protein
VQLDLRGDGAGQNPAVAHDRGAGFVAGSFKGKNRHVDRSGVSANRRISSDN